LIRLGCGICFSYGLCSLPLLFYFMHLGFLFLPFSEMAFSIAFYHMGKFESFKGRFLRYQGGEEHVVHGVDADRWSYFEAFSILKEEFKYDGMVKLWWKPKRGRMDKDLKPFGNR